MNQLPLGQPLFRAACADALNPQLAILAFFDAAGRAWRNDRPFALPGRLVELLSGRKKPFVLLRYFLRRARALVPLLRVPSFLLRFLKPGLGRKSFFRRV